MRPASLPPARRDAVRLQCIDPNSGRIAERPLASLAHLLDERDTLVVNDAATLPASLRGRWRRGAIEVRLVGAIDDQRWRAVVFGTGDWRTPTERRGEAPQLTPGSRLELGDAANTVRAEVVAVGREHPRLVELRFELEGVAFWRALHAAAAPVRYAHLRRALPLKTFQTGFATRPWAVEMPSAGRPLTWRLLLALRRRGVRVSPLTHAAGLSSTGDPTLDRLLPFPERYDIPESTVNNIAHSRARGGRVVAVGTTVVRALEDSARRHGQPRAGEAIAALRLGSDDRTRVVDGVVSGMHDTAESHFALLSAVASATQMRRAVAHAEARGFRAHELGDLCLILPGVLPATRSLRGPSRRGTPAASVSPPAAR
jgi:S-adenosylmethionine:tRNA ribosyltransferase-isomerase